MLRAGKDIKRIPTILGASLFSIASTAFASDVPGKEPEPESQTATADIADFTPAESAVEFWKKTLSGMQGNGLFQPNPEIRAKNLKPNQRSEWTHNHDFIHDDTLVDPAYKGTDAEQQFDTARQELGMIADFLYNGGYSYFLFHNSMAEEFANDPALTNSKRPAS